MTEQTFWERVQLTRQAEGTLSAAYGVEAGRRAKTLIKTEREEESQSGSLKRLHINPLVPSYSECVQV